MKINGFEVEHQLDMGDDGIVRGWIQTPALPHVTYRVEISQDDINFPEPEVSEEIELTDVQPAAVTPGDVGSQVSLPDGTVAPVVATPPPADDPQ